MSAPHDHFDLIIREMIIPRKRYDLFIKSCGNGSSESSIYVPSNLVHRISAQRKITVSVFWFPIGIHEGGVICQNLGFNMKEVSYQMRKLI